MSDFVQPEIVRLLLSGGAWIDVKKELTAGEQRKVFAGMVRDYDQADGRALLDPEQVGRTKITAYLVDWSLTDAAGKPVPVSDAAIDNLRVTRYEEIRKAIDTHEKAQDAVHAKN